MCNIAGYVGNLNATEVLIKLIKAQEGLDCGFYTGIAVHDGENLHYQKTVGDLNTLLTTTNAQTFKGNMGVVHSRTPSGGDKEWAHPFYSYKNGDLKQCYVANGSIGCFINNNERYNQIATNLYNEGYNLPSKNYSGSDLFNKLPNGASVHLSDIMCQLIFKYKQDGLDTITAFTNACYTAPKEIVGLLIEKETPNAIYFSRINMPMFVGFDDNGAYLVSSPTAFPSTVKEFKLLPALSSGVVYKDRVVIKKYQKFHKKVRRFTTKTIEKASDIIFNLISDSPKSFDDFRLKLMPLYKDDKLTQLNTIVYLAIYKLLKEDKITFTYTSVTVDGLTAPKILIAKK